MITTILSFLRERRVKEFYRKIPYFFSDITRPNQRLRCVLFIVLGVFCQHNTVFAQESFGNALDFDGANDYVDLGTSQYFNSFAFVNTLTLETWVRPTANFNPFVPSSFIIKEDDIDWDWSLRTEGNTLSFFLKTATGAGAVASTPNTDVPVNQWTHIAATYDGSTIKLYVNGVLKSSEAISGYLGNNYTLPVSLGGHPQYGWYFQGQMDEVRIWNVARTQAQIQAGMSPTNVPPASTLCYLKMDNGTPNAANMGRGTATDASPYGLHGTLVNFGLTGNNSNWVAHSPYVTLNAEETSIINNTAMLNANLGEAGTGTISERGFIWGVTGTNLSLTSGTKVIVSGTGTGVFSANITGLSATQTYTYCAYAISTDGYTLSAPSTLTSSAWGNALDFDGVDDYVDLGTSPYFNSYTFSNSLTLEAWIRPTANFNPSIPSALIIKLVIIFQFYIVYKYLINSYLYLYLG